LLCGGANSALLGSPPVPASSSPSSPLPPPRSVLGPPTVGRYGKEGPSSAGSTQTTPRPYLAAGPLEQLPPGSARTFNELPGGPSRGWNGGAGREGMRLPTLEARPGHFPGSLPTTPGQLPAFDGRHLGVVSLRSRERLQQAAGQLEETRRLLESASASRDRDALRAAISDCAPLERLLEALAKARETLVELEGGGGEAAEAGSFAAPADIPPSAPALVAPGVLDGLAPELGLPLEELEEGASDAELVEDLDRGSPSPI